MTQSRERGLSHLPMEGWERGTGSWRLLLAVSAMWAAGCESENKKRVVAAVADFADTLSLSIADTEAVAVGKIAPVSAPRGAVGYHASVWGRSALVPLRMSCWERLCGGRAKGLRLLAAGMTVRPGPCNCDCCRCSCCSGKMLFETGYC